MKAHYNYYFLATLNSQLFVTISVCNCSQKCININDNLRTKISLSANLRDITTTAAGSHILFYADVSNRHDVNHFQSSTFRGIQMLRRHKDKSSWNKCLPSQPLGRVLGLVTSQKIVPMIRSKAFNSKTFNFGTRFWQRLQKQRDGKDGVVMLSDVCFICSVPSQNAGILRLF